MFSNGALQEVNQTLISAARSAGWLSRVAAHLPAQLQDHRCTSQALPGATRPPESGKGHAAHLLKSPCWGISPRRAPCPRSSTLPASRSAPAQCRTGSSPPARAAFSLHRTATPSTSRLSPAERHPGEPFKQRQEGTSSDAATSQRASPGAASPEPFISPVKLSCSKAPCTSKPGSSPAESQDLLRQSHGATAISWKAQQIQSQSRNRHPPRQLPAHQRSWISS